MALRPELYGKKQNWKILLLVDNATSHYGMRVMS